MFDLDLITKSYQELSAKIERAKKHLKRPLTLSEKILYAHLYGDQSLSDFKRGIDYVDFAPDRVAIAGCHCPNGFAAIYELRKEQNGRTFNSALRSPDSGQ